MRHKLTLGGLVLGLGALGAFALSHQTEAPVATQPAAPAPQPAVVAAIAEAPAPQAVQSGLIAFVDDQGRLRAPKPGEAAAAKAAQPAAATPATPGFTTQTHALDPNDPSRGTITITIPDNLLHSTVATKADTGNVHLNCVAGCTADHGAQPLFAEVTE